MKEITKNYFVIGFSMLCLLVGSQIAAAQGSLSPQDKKTIAEFEKRAKQYVEIREKLERKLPKLPKNATPVQIEKHKIALQKSVQSARAAAKQGDIFNPAAAQLIRNIIKSQVKGEARTELRETVLGADTKGVPLKINFPYPEDKEQVEMPPDLLLILPQLPKQLRFRYVGRHLLVMDRENELIIDYMTNALP